MSEAAGGGGRAEFERNLVQRSLEDEDFRQRLLGVARPTRALLPEHFGE